MNIYSTMNLYYFDWDNFAFVIAALDKIKGKRAKEIKRQFVAAMRSYDGSTGGMPRTMTSDIKNRVEYWKERIRK